VFALYKVAKALDRPMDAFVEGVDEDGSEPEGKPGRSRKKTPASPPPPPAPGEGKAQRRRKR
jgi:hypothetical protein